MDENRDWARASNRSRALAWGGLAFLAVFGTLLLPGPEWLPHISWAGWGASYRSDLGAGVLGGLVVGAAVLWVERDSQDRERRQTIAAVRALGAGPHGSVARAVRIAFQGLDVQLWHAQDTGGDLVRYGRDAVEVAVGALRHHGATARVCARLNQLTGAMILYGPPFVRTYASVEGTHTEAAQRDLAMMESNLKVAQATADEELRMVAERLLAIDPTQAGELLHARAVLTSAEPQQPATFAGRAIFALRDSFAEHRTDMDDSNHRNLAGSSERRMAGWLAWWAASTNAELDPARRVDRDTAARDALAELQHGIRQDCDERELMRLEDELQLALTAAVPDELAATPSIHGSADGPPDVLEPRDLDELIKLAQRLDAPTASRRPA